MPTINYNTIVIHSLALPEIVAFDANVGGEGSSGPFSQFTILRAAVIGFKPSAVQRNEVSAVTSA